jgi:putative SOS response-associated peptidase YedK
MRWLDGDTQLLDEVTTSPPEFQAWPVDRMVNNARNESPELINAAGASLAR